MSGPNSGSRVRLSHNIASMMYGTVLSHDKNLLAHNANDIVNEVLLSHQTHKTPTSMTDSGVPCQDEKDELQKKKKKKTGSSKMSVKSLLNCYKFEFFTFTFCIILLFKSKVALQD